MGLDVFQLRATKAQIKVGGEAVLHLSCSPTTSACHWPQKRRWSSWWPRPSPHDRSWSCWWSTCMRTSPLWSDREKGIRLSSEGKWAEQRYCCVNYTSPACVVALPVCNTSSRPQARWTFPQGEGDSGLLTLPAWQKASGARGCGGGIRHYHWSVFGPDVHLHQWAPDGSSLPPGNRQCKCG